MKISTSLFFMFLIAMTTYLSTCNTGKKLLNRLKLNTRKDCSSTNYADEAGKLAGEVGKKIAAAVGEEIVGEIAGPIIGVVTTVLGFIGDAVQRDKCKLRCCPPNNLKGSWACKYQNKQTCNGSYSDYPGHGDHACWWNEALGRCETGNACRDKTFNFFSLFGSTCPPCSECPPTEPQWSLEALRANNLPDRFWVDPADEYLWCAPRGSDGDCDSNNSNPYNCLRSYADHDGDKNCKWIPYYNGKGGCVPGPKCDNARERGDAARSLGLEYYDGAWRRNGVAIDNYNHDQNRGGASKQTATALWDVLHKGVSQYFKNCARNCKNSHADIHACLKQCVLTYH